MSYLIEIKALRLEKCGSWARREPSRFKLESAFLMRPNAALVAASPAFTAHCPQGQFYRASLDECVSSSSPLARPYRHTANAGKRSRRRRKPIRMSPLIRRPADPPPDEVDEAAWRTLPLLRAAEARWAAMVSPLRDETQPRDPWPWLSVYGPSKRPQQQ